MKKRLAWMLCMMLIFTSLATGPILAEAADAYVPPEGWDIVEAKELERAGAYGLVPEEWADALDEPVSHAQFCDLVERLILAANRPEALDQWRQYAADAMQSEARCPAAMPGWG